MRSTRLSILLTLLLLTNYTLQAQVRIDTLGTYLGKVSIDGVNYYQGINAEGDTLRIKPDIRPYVSDRSRILQPRYWGEERSKDRFFFRNGKIVNQNNEPICDQEFDQVHANFNDNFLVSKDGSCFILSKDCKLQFLQKIRNKEEISLSRSISHHFFIKGKKKKSANLYSWKGELLTEVQSKDGYRLPNYNKYYFYTFEDPRAINNSRRYNHKVYNLNGEYITEGKIIGDNQEVLFIENKRGEKEIYSKNDKIPLPENVDSILFHYDKVIAIDQQGLLRYFNNALKPDFIQEPFITYDLISFDFMARQHAQQHNFGKTKDLISLIDTNEQIRLYDYLGKPINTGFEFKNPGIEYESGKSKLYSQSVCIVELNEDILFVSIKDHLGQVHLFDEKWNVLTTVQAAKKGDYTLEGTSNTGLATCRVPPGILDYFKDKIEDQEFFVVKGAPTRGKNIVDFEANLLFEKNISWPMKINKNHFLLNDRSNKRNTQKKKYLVKITRI